MLRLICIVALVIAVAVPCMAVVGQLGMYADEQGNECQLQDAGGLIATYVVHKYPWDGAMGCRFKIEPPDNGTWLFLTFETSFNTVGDALSDLSVDYNGACIQAQTTVGRALWLSTVPVPECGFVSIKPATPGQIIIWDCSFVEQSIPAAQPLYVNPTPACNCWGATQPTTWGSVKALYR